MKVSGVLGLIAYVFAFGGSAFADDGYFDSAGTKIRYVSEGDGIAVLLVHGFTTNLKIAWIDSGIYKALTSGGYRVVAFDHRGHGASDSPSAPDMYGVELVADARRLLDHLGIEKAHILGYSMGGTIAAKFGELYPDRAHSLVLGGTQGPFWQPEPLTEDQAAEAIVIWGLEGKMTASAIAALSHEYTDMMPNEAALSDIENPTMVIVGEDDDHKDGAAKLAMLIPNAELVVVPGGHDEAILTSEFLSAIMEFLASRTVK